MQLSRPTENPFPTVREAARHTSKRLTSCITGDHTWQELRGEFERYSSLINAADLAPTSKTTYHLHADRFVRWPAGEVEIAPEDAQARSDGSTYPRHVGEPQD